VDDLVTEHRGDAGVVGWADGVLALYQRAVAHTATDPATRQQARQGYVAELRALCAPFCGDQAAPQRVLCARIMTHLHDLFVFVEDSAVPPPIRRRSAACAIW
jgi:hypothetical protein